MILVLWTSPEPVIICSMQVQQLMHRQKYKGAQWLKIHRWDKSNKRDPVEPTEKHKLPKCFPVLQSIRSTAISLDKENMKKAIQ